MKEKAHRDVSLAAAYKGMTEEDAETILEQSQDRLTRMVILDRYRSFLLEFPLMSVHPLNYDAAQDILKYSLDLTMAGFVEPRLLFSAVSNRMWKEFQERYEDVETTRRKLLGIGEGDYMYLRTVVKNMEKARVNRRARMATPVTPA